jgi:hypothetical protein
MPGTGNVLEAEVEVNEEGESQRKARAEVIYQKEVDKAEAYEHEARAEATERSSVVANVHVNIMEFEQW